MTIGQKGANIYTSGCATARAFIFINFHLLNRNTSKVTKEILAPLLCWTCHFWPHLAAIRFARFFSFRFRTRPRTFYGASERFAKPRMEIITSFSSRATPCEPSKAIRRLRTDRIAARFYWLSYPGWGLCWNWIVQILFVVRAIFLAQIQ